MVGITKEDNLSGEGFQQPVELDILVNAAGGSYSSTGMWSPRMHVHTTIQFDPAPKSPTRPLSSLISGEGYVGGYVR